MSRKAKSSPVTLEKLVYSKYRRPQRLSDPGSDFSEGMLKDLLRKADSDLRWSDYRNLLGPYLPAGTYEEVIYFLPGAFTYLQENEDDALELVSAVFGFCSINIDRLRDDHLDQAVRDRVRASFDFWVRDFKVEHLDRQKCSNKGWGLKYFDCVRNTETICEGMIELVRFETLAEEAVGFIKSLANHNGDTTMASWFLELSRARSDVYAPPNLASIQELLADRRALTCAADAVRHIAGGGNRTYWRDTLNELGLELR